MKRSIKTVIILSVLLVLVAASAGTVAAQEPKGDLYTYGERGTIEADVYGGCVYFEVPYLGGRKPPPEPDREFLQQLGEGRGRLAVTIKGVDPEQVYVEEYERRGIRRYSVGRDTVRIVGTAFSGEVCSGKLLDNLNAQREGGFSISLAGSEYGFSTMAFGEATLTGRGSYCYSEFYGERCDPYKGGNPWSGQTIPFGGGIAP